MEQNQKRSRLMLICAMCIFGTIGILRKYIPYSSAFVALIRGIVGTLFLCLVLLLGRKKPDGPSIRNNFPLLLLSGAAIGFNWILLFEAYCYTSVATATLCYYLSPILVILASPLVLKERLTGKKVCCAALALTGMVLVSGVMDAGFQGIGELKGVLFGLGAAVLYASVILMNKIMRHRKHKHPTPQRSVVDIDESEILRRQHIEKFIEAVRDDRELIRVVEESHDLSPDALFGGSEIDEKA